MRRLGPHGPVLAKRTQNILRFEEQDIKRGSGLRSLNFIIAATTELSWTKYRRNFKARSLQVAVRHFLPHFYVLRKWD